MFYVYCLRREGRAYMGKDDGKNLFGLIEDVHLFGGRGFSLLNSSLARVWESGEDLEARAAEFYSQTFNGDCSSLNESPVSQADQRSDDMVSMQ